MLSLPTKIKVKFSVFLDEIDRCGERVDCNVRPVVHRAKMHLKFFLLWPSPQFVSLLDSPFKQGKRKRLLVSGPSSWTMVNVLKKNIIYLTLTTAIYIVQKYVEFYFGCVPFGNVIFMYLYYLPSI